jgi:hypothetical protein
MLLSLGPKEGYFVFLVEHYLIKVKIFIQCHLKWMKSLTKRILNKQKPKCLAKCNFNSKDAFNTVSYETIIEPTVEWAYSYNSILCCNKETIQEG